MISLLVGNAQPPSHIISPLHIIDHLHIIAHHRCSSHISIAPQSAPPPSPPPTQLDIDLGSLSPSFCLSSLFFYRLSFSMVRCLLVFRCLFFPFSTRPVLNDLDHFGRTYRSRFWQNPMPTRPLKGRKAECIIWVASIIAHVLESQHTLIISGLIRIAQC